MCTAYDRLMCRCVECRGANADVAAINDGARYEPQENVARDADPEWTGWRVWLEARRPHGPRRRAY